MSGKAARVLLSEKLNLVLQEMSRSTALSQRLIQRATIILLAADKLSNQEIARQVNLGRKQVGLWRRRWRDSFETLVSIECGESHAAFRRAVEDVLTDAPRCGAPGKFTAEEVSQVIATACEPPEQSGRPITEWTHRELAEEVTKRQIVDSISPAQVGRYLRATRLQPHRRKYWLNTKEKDADVFQRQVEEVCRTWQEAEDLYFQAHTHTVSVDEMPGLQALERIAPAIPMQPGRPERIEYEYKRHGTQCLIGNWHVVEGQMIAPTIRATRTEQDFSWHIHQTVRTDRKAGWVFVVDQLNIHCSATLVGYVADLEGLDRRTLGKKGVRGILKSMASRQEFLSNRHHRVRFVYLPKHSSWLNQIEIVFGVISRRVMRHGSFRSVGELKAQLLSFLEYFNGTFAKPFHWKYTGHRVETETIRRPLDWKEKWVKRCQKRLTSALVG